MLLNYTFIFSFVLYFYAAYKILFIKKPSALHIVVMEIVGSVLTSFYLFFFPIPVIKELILGITEGLGNNIYLELLGYFILVKVPYSWLLIRLVPAYHDYKEKKEDVSKSKIRN